MSELLDHFVDGGFNMIDTADVYSNWIPGNHGGESETIIGKWLKQSGKRDRVLIATKSGLDMGNGRKGLSKKHILQSADESLSRLQTDYIDLYQSHTEDKETPLEETLEAYAELIKAGKVRVIGASNFQPATLQAALEDQPTRKILPRYESLQPEYNLYVRAKFEGELEAVCRENHIGVIPYFSLASGFLTGKYRSEKDLENRSRGSRVQKYLNPRGLRILAALDEVSEAVQRHSCSGFSRLAAGQADDNGSHCQRHQREAVGRTARGDTREIRWRSDSEIRSGQRVLGRGAQRRVIKEWVTALTRRTSWGQPPLAVQQRLQISFPQDLQMMRQMSCSDESHGANRKPFIAGNSGSHPRIFWHIPEKCNTRTADVTKFLDMRRPWNSHRQQLQRPQYFDHS